MALDFEASSSQRISVGSNLGIDGGSMSVLAWYKPESDPASGDADAIFEQKSDTTTNTRYALAYENSAGTLRCYALRAANGVSNGFAIFNITLTSDRWYHLAFTYDGTTIRLFIDAIERASTTHTDTGSIDNVDKTSIGDFDGSNYADGVIDDVKVFDRALTAAEIENYRWIRLVGNEAGLRAYWRLDEQSSLPAAGTTIIDFTGHGYTMGPNTAPSYTDSAPISYLG